MMNHSPDMANASYHTTSLVGGASTNADSTAVGGATTIAGGASTKGIGGVDSLTGGASTHADSTAAGGATTIAGGASTKGTGGAVTIKMKINTVTPPKLDVPLSRPVRILKKRRLETAAPHRVVVNLLPTSELYEASSEIIAHHKGDAYSVTKKKTKASSNIANEGNLVLLSDSPYNSWEGSVVACLHKVSHQGAIVERYSVCRVLRGCPLGMEKFSGKILVRTPSTTGVKNFCVFPWLCRLLPNDHHSANALEVAEAELRLDGRDVME